MCEEKDQETFECVKSKISACCCPNCRPGLRYVPWPVYPMPYWPYSPWFPPYPTYPTHPIVWRESSANSGSE